VKSSSIRYDLSYSHTRTVKVQQVQRQWPLVLLLPLGFRILSPPPSMPTSPVGGLVGTAEVGAINAGAAKVGTINASAAKVGAINAGVSEANASDVGAARTALGAGLSGAGLGVPVVVSVILVSGLVGPGVLSWTLGK
jgi:hypothetical protein